MSLFRVNATKLLVQHRTAVGALRMAASTSDTSAADAVHDTPLAPSFEEREDSSLAAPVEGADEGQDEEIATEDDDCLDVVVTGVELDPSYAGASVVGAALLLGLQPYIVELVVSRSSGSYCIRRSLTAFLASVTTATNGVVSDDGQPVKCPEFPPKHSRSDAILAQWCADATQFLADYASELKKSEDWIKTVVDSAVANAKTRAHMTAIEFILQPFPFEKIYVPRGSRHEIVLQVKKEDQFIVWRFEVEDHDIDLTIHFLATPSRRTPRGEPSAEVTLETIHPTTRYVATPGERPTEGMFQCSRPGTATLVWDNSYSRLRGKNVQYQVQAVHKSIMESATAAADAYEEAIQAKIQREDVIRSSKKQAAASTQLVVSPRLTPSTSTLGSSSYLLDTSAHLYRQLFADKLPTQNWLVSAPMNVAGKLASRLFGTPQQEGQTGSQLADGDDDDLPSHTDGREAKSLLEELNGLNMQLLERLESCEDKIAKLTVERDQERSRSHLANVAKENASAVLTAKELELQTIRNDLQRFERERVSWLELQHERDALLDEKHRWAMANDFVVEGDEDQTGRTDLDTDTKNRLEHELGRSEASVLRLRAELGYPLNNTLTGTSSRLEKIAKELTASKKQYEDQTKAAEQQAVELKQQIVKYRSQKRVLVAEIRNMQTQSESQVAVAMAEANEARMVNKRLKKQNELLLTQIRSLVDDAREQEKKLQDEVEQKIKHAQLALQRLHNDEAVDGDITNDDRVQATTTVEKPQEQEPVDEEATVPYTLSAADLAMLNGEQPPSIPARVPTPPPVPAPLRSSRAATAAPPERQRKRKEEDEEEQVDASGSPYRRRLVAFFREKDPSMLPEVDAMLASYVGVEEMLFDSLELKYNFMAFSE